MKRRLLATLTVLTFFTYFYLRPLSISGFRRISQNSIELLLDEKACLKPIHLGLENNQGGWDLCGPMLPKQCTVLSFGIGKHFSFDVAADKEWGCVVHGMDPSIDEAKTRPVYEASPNRHLHMVGVGPETGTFAPGALRLRWPGEHSGGKPSNSKPWAIETVADAFKRLKLDHVDVFKMDVEGGEWYALRDFHVHHLYNKFDQLVVELHFKPGQYQLFKERGGGVRIVRNFDDDLDYFQSLEKLFDAGFRMWRLNWNTQHCLEISFLLSSPQRFQAGP